MIRSRRLQHLVLLFALAGVLLRGAIPAGFMPAFGGDAYRGAWLMPCDGSDHGSMSMAAHASMSMAAMGDHGGGHDAHGSQDCPYAAAATPALPSSPALLTTEATDALTLATSFATAAPSRRLRAVPPARGPPSFS